MDRLPHELTDLISEELETTDLKSLRLVCGGFSSPGASSAKALFKSLDLFCHRTSFDCINGIAQSRALSPHVQHLNFYPVFFNTKNVRVLRNHARNSGVEQKKFKAAVRDFWLTLPDTIGETSFHRLSIADTLRRFCNLKSITIYGHSDLRYRWLRKYQPLPGIEGVFSKEHSMESDLMCMLDFMNAIARARVKVDLIKLVGIHACWFVDAAGIYRQCYDHHDLSPHAQWTNYTALAQGSIGSVEMGRSSGDENWLRIVGNSYSTLVQANTCAEAGQILGGAFERLCTLELDGVRYSHGTVQQLDIFLQKHQMLDEIIVMDSVIDDAIVAMGLLSTIQKLVEKATIVFSFSDACIPAETDWGWASTAQRAPRGGLPLEIWRYLKRQETDATLSAYLLDAVGLVSSGEYDSTSSDSSYGWQAVTY